MVCFLSMQISMNMQILAGVLVAVCAYFIGNINNAVMISKALGRDIRKLGSGNPGTMNMIRNFGKPIGAVTLILDVLKGVVPCLLGWCFMGNGEFLMLGADRLGLYVGGFFAVLGHIYPAAMKFKGGKGAATIIGVCLTNQPLWTIGFFALGVAFLFVTKIGSLTSFIMISAPLTAEGVLAAGQGWLCATLVFLMLALSIFAHRSNIVKLFGGREGSVTLKKSKKNIQPDRSIVFDSVKIAE